MNALVFLGGEAPDPDALVPVIHDSYGIIAAADSGLIVAEASGFRPDIVAGDFDSIDSLDRLSGYPEKDVFRFPSDKDDTDAVLAIRLCTARGAERVDLVGGGGGRLDHFLDLLSFIGKEKSVRRWYLPGNVLEVLEGEKDETGKNQIPEYPSFKGEVLSLFAIGAETLEVESEGLSWPLSGLRFKPGEGSMSNRSTGDAFGLRILKGRGLLVRRFPEA